MFDNRETVFGGSSRLHSLIELIYAAVEDISLWPDVLARTSTAMEGESLALFAAFPDLKVAGILGLHEMSPEAWNLFATRFAQLNPIMARVQGVLTTGVTLYSHHVITDAELERTEFYNEFFQPFDMHYSAGLRLNVDGLPVANLSCQRSKAKGPFDERIDVVMQTLRPHFQRAILLTHRLGHLEAAQLGLGTALDRLDRAVFGLDKRGRVVFSNSRAERIAMQDQGLRLSDGSLTASRREQNKELQALLADAVAAGCGNGISAGGSMRIRPQASGPELHLTAVPVVSPLPGCPAGLAALVFVHSPTLRPQSRAATMRALFHLTPTEARMADLLLEGLEVREVANTLQMTLETARYHLKRIFAKTGTGRQSELVKQMLSLPSVQESQSIQ